MERFLRCSFLMLLLVAPALAYAAAAGFAPGALWLSTTEVSAGDTMKVFTVLYNSSQQPIEGDVDFDVDADSIQTEHFKLAAGESSLVSADWSAQEGSHTFSAQLKNVSGVDGALTTTKTNSVSIAVAHGTPSALTTYVNIANNFIASSSPEVSNVLTAIASTTESWRQAGADWLSKELYIDQALGSSTAPGPKASVLGTSTINTQNTAQQSSLPGALKRWVLTGLFYVCNIQILFYIVLLAVLYALFKIVQAIFRSSRRGD